MKAPEHQMQPIDVDSRAWRLADRTLDLDRPLIVAVVNATPDSFSDRGADRSPAAAAGRVVERIEAGADVIEAGGESNVSNRPAVDPAEEIERVLPVVVAAKSAGAIVSVDTYKPAVAAAALDAGADVINDISGFADPDLVSLCAEQRPGVVLMHTITPPKVSLWDDGAYGDDVAASVTGWLADGVERLTAAGIAREAIALDPGVDFGKTPAQSVQLMRAFADVCALGHPVMSAVSRKDFVGALTGRRPSERLAGTLAAVGWAVGAGARLVRAHDVAETRDFLTVLDALEGRLEVPAELRIDEAIRREAPDPAG
jgi:dihydropteroate synthase